MIDRRALAAILALAGIIFVVIGCLQVRDGRLYGRHSRAVHQGADQPGSEFRTANPDSADESLQSPAANLDQSQIERGSLLSLLNLMREFAIPGSSSAQLFARLKESAQEPEISAMSVPEVGSIVTITTKSPALGTRYFRSVFERDTTGELMDFMTFEFRPGEKALEEAEAAVQEIFGNVEVRERTADVVVFNVSDEYEVMVNRIVEDHLNAEPNVRRYTREDLGVIEVTVQLRHSEH